MADRVLFCIQKSIQPLETCVFVDHHHHCVAHSRDVESPHEWCAMLISCEGPNVFEKSRYGVVCEYVSCLSGACGQFRNIFISSFFLSFLGGQNPTSLPMNHEICWTPSYLLVFDLVNHHTSKPPKRLGTHTSGALFCFFLPFVEANTQLDDDCFCYFKRSSLVPLIDGLCSSDSISRFCVYNFCFAFSEDNKFQRKKIN